MSECRLMFVCPELRQAFDSGFKFSPEETRQVPVGYTMRLRCGACFGRHEFRVSDGWLAPPSAGPQHSSGSGSC